MAEEEGLKGITQVVANFSKFERNLVTELVAACEAVQQNVINSAQARVPVVTSNLQKSIMPAGIVIEQTNVTAAVGANANYAGFVEGVDSNWKPLANWTHKITPYLGPALLENQRTFVKALSAAVKRAEESIG